MSTSPTVAAVNARFGYDPKRFHYGGLSLPGGEGRIAHIVRFPLGETSLDKAEALTAGGSRWGAARFDFAGEDAGVRGVGLSAGLFALTAAALFDKNVGSAARSGHASGGRVYAIVEADDTTAVVELVMIKKGPTVRRRNGDLVRKPPQVFRRNGGLWVRDDMLLEQFLSANPPPIVELEGSVRADVISQIDGKGANQVVTDEQGRNAKVGPSPAGAVSGGTGLVAKPVGPKRPRGGDDPVHEAGRSERPVGAKRKPENRPSRTTQDSEEGPGTRPSLTASIAAERDADIADHAWVRRQHRDVATSWYYSDEGYAAGFDLMASLERADVDYQRRVTRTRAETARWMLNEAQRLRVREAELKVVLPVLVAAGSRRG